MIDQQEEEVEALIEVDEVEDEVELPLTKLWLNAIRGRGPCDIYQSSSLKQLGFGIHRLLVI